MFTGIVKGVLRVVDVQRRPDMIQFSIKVPKAFLDGLEVGASVAIDGVCLTVTRIHSSSLHVSFDAIQETLSRTTLNELHIDRKVNVERSAKFSDEIGGHIVSGHVFGKAQIHQIAPLENHQKMVFHCPKEWMKYFFEKGFIAIDGASLTLVDVDPTGFFSVHLIPETLKATTLGTKQEKDWVNIELDSRTQSIVETIERILKSTSLIRPN